MRHGYWWTAMLLAAAPACAQDATGIAPDCPAPKMAVPVYPVDALRSRRQGEVVVEAKTDACGRVLEARIQVPSRHKDLNAAALDAAHRSILAADKRDTAVDGWVAWPIDFSIDDSSTSKPVDWPRTHRVARYVVDDSLDQSIGVAAYRERMVDMEAGVVRPPVVNLRHAFRQVQGEAGLEFWLFLSIDDASSVAARYRPVLEDGEPVVRMALRCELEASQCASLQKALLERGLPMSRVKR